MLINFIRKKIKQLITYFNRIYNLYISIKNMLLFFY